MQTFKSARFATGAVLFLCSLAIAQAGTAASVNGLYYTGVNASGGLLAGGTTDPHWAVTYAYANGISDNPAYQGPAYVVNGAYAFPDWVPNTSSAQWITAPGAQTTATGGTTNTGGAYLPGNGTTNPNRGTYVYTLTFEIGGTGSGLVTNQVSIALTLAADNQATVYVNPTLNNNGNINTGSSTLGGFLPNAWDNTSVLTLQNYGGAPNASFVIGTNTIVIRVDNTRSINGGSNLTSLNPSGLLVYQTGTAILIDGRPVPEVGLWLPIVGALGLFFWKRRREASNPLSAA